MTQSEKMQFRILAILKQSRVAWGDQANTINTAANQYRILKQQLQNVGRTIGNLFIPIVEKALPVINGMVIALNRLLTSLGFSLFGKNWLSDLMSEVSSGNIEGLDDLEDDLDDVSDAEDEATKKAKELRKQLQGIDELNNLSRDTDSDSSSSKDNDSSAGTIDLSDAISAELANYDKIWEDALKGHENKAEEWADAITKAFSDKFTLGKLIKDKIISAFDIDWENDVYPNFNDWGSDLASFMAGLITPDDKGATIFSALGSAVAGGVNSAIAAFTGWNDTFTKLGGWENFGKGVATYLKTIVNDIKWEDSYKLVTKIANGIAKAINEFNKEKPLKAIGKAIGNILKDGIAFWSELVSDKGGIDFKELGENIGEGINGFFDTMGEKITSGKNKGKTSWEVLGKNISNSIDGIVTAINTALKTVKWEEVGKAIGQLISNIKWSALFFDMTKMVGRLASAIKTAIKGWKKEDPFSATLVAAICAAKFSGLTSKLSTAVGTVLKGKTLNLPANTKIKLAGAILVVSGISDLVNGIKKKDVVDKVKGAMKIALGGSLLVSVPLNVAIPLTIATGAVTWAADIWSQIFKAGFEEGPEKGKSLLQSALDDMWKDIKDGTFHFQLPGIELFSYEELFGDDGYWTKEIGKLKEQLSGLKNDIKSGFDGLIADFKDSIIKKLRELPESVQKFFGIDKLELSTEKKKATSTTSSKTNNVVQNSTTGAYTSWLDSQVGDEIGKGLSDALELLKSNPEYSVKINATSNLDDVWKDVETKWGTGKKLDVGIKRTTSVADLWNSNNGLLTGWKSSAKNLNVGVKQTTSTSTLWGNLKNNWGSNKNLEVGTKQTTSASTLWNNLNNKWGTKNLLVGTKNTTSASSLWSNSQKDGLKDKWGTSKNLSVGLKDFTNTQVKDLYGDNKKGLVKTWGTKNLSVGISKITDSKAKVFHDSIQEYFDKHKLIVSLTGTNNGNTNADPYNLINKTQKAKGGVYSQGTWKSIDQYANGGIPSHGSVFVAGEAGAEVVGHVNGRTEVLNQSQIASAIYQATYNAMDSVMRQYNGGNGDTVVQIDGKEVARATQRVANDYMRRTGNPYFAY